MDKVRARMAAFLAAHRTGVFSVNASEGTWATLVQCRSHGLAVDCLVPCWSDVAYYLEQDPRVLLIFPDSAATGPRWLQYLGQAHRLDCPDWTQWKIDRLCVARETLDALYLVVRVTPRRIDLFDADQGWGARETLDV
jgi:hypothetical protein